MGRVGGVTGTRRCVVVGATGYTGGRLVPELLQQGHEVLVVARSPDKLLQVPWRNRVEMRSGDVTAPGWLQDTLGAGDVVYYLVHSLTRPDFVGWTGRPPGPSPPPPRRPVSGGSSTWVG